MAYINAGTHVSEPLYGLEDLNKKIQFQSSGIFYKEIGTFLDLIQSRFYFVQCGYIVVKTVCNLGLIVDDQARYLAPES